MEIMFMSFVTFIINFVCFANTRSEVFAIAFAISFVSCLAILFGAGVSEIGESKWGVLVYPVTCIGGLVIGCMQMDMLSTPAHRLVLLQMVVMSVYSVAVLISSLKGAKAE